MSHAWANFADVRAGVVTSFKLPDKRSKWPLPGGNTMLGRGSTYEIMSHSPTGPTRSRLMAILPSWRALGLTQRETVIADRIDANLV